MAAEVEAVAQATGNPWALRPPAAGRLAGTRSRNLPADRGHHTRDGGARRRTVADRCGLGDRRAQQWPGPLRRGAGRRRARHRHPHELGWRPARWPSDRSGGPGRGTRTRGRRHGAPVGDHHGQRHRLGSSRIQARSPALLSDGESAERLYLEAIRRLGHTRIRAELARATCSTASVCAARTAAPTHAAVRVALPDADRDGFRRVRRARPA